MSKGGARQSNFKMPVGRGMGLNRLILVLRVLNIKNLSVQQVHEKLYIYFGGERSETARACLKELWRLGMIDFLKNNQIISFSESNWNVSSGVWAISSCGKELLGLKDGLKSFYFAEKVADVYKDSRSPQLTKIIETYKIKNSLPVNSEQCGILCGGIDLHGMKVWNFGFLEPTGLLYRTKIDNKEYFNFNFEYFEEIKKINIGALNALDYLENINEIGVYECGKRQEFEIEYNVDGVCEITLNKFFKKRINILNVKVLNKKLIIKLELVDQKISESYIPTSIGTMKINNKVYLLPSINIVTPGDKEEKEVISLLRKLDLDVLPIAHSDRPDAIITPNRKEVDIKKYLENDEKKILLEVSKINTLAKIEEDLKNFISHTQKVLKINAERTLIVRRILPNNIYNEVGKWIKTNKFPQNFTIITIEDLEYLIKKCTSSKKINFEEISCILEKNGVVERKNIVDLFSKN